MPLESPTLPVLSIDGEIDLATRDAVTALLAPCLGGPASEVILLTCGVTFIDCAGLTPIHRAARRLRAGGGRLWLPMPAPALVRLARLTRCSDELGLTAAGPTTTMRPPELSTAERATPAAPATFWPPRGPLVLTARTAGQDLR